MKDGDSVVNQTWNNFEAASYIGCSPGTIMNWACKRKIPFLKVNGLTRFRKKDLDRWLDSVLVQENQL